MLNLAKIDLNAIRDNALKVKKGIGNAKLCAVVKADAYGHGAPVVANALYSICDVFAVALLEEGIALRQSGIDKDILLLIPPFLSDIKNAVRYSITLAVDNPKTVYQLQTECEKQDKTCKVHIKFNSGMNRLGTDLDGVKSILTAIDECERVFVDGIFSHLKSPENLKSVEKQRDKFLLANNIVKGYNNKVISHLSASGGFLQGQIFDMVRIGILLYGYLPFETKSFSVTPAMQVYAPVVTRRKIKKGQSALYGNLTAKSHLDLSIIRYGYADGLQRAKVDNQFNNRCMDVTAIKSLSLTNGFVCVMDSAEQIAKSQNTISYEVLTKCAMRAQRIYIN
ncbi:MAG: alanine racemase [Clostridia bacterium]|nr:alanine racemase [Clostridia bacterium]